MLPLPHLGFGLGLRATHYPHILEHRPREVEWFEIISENFMTTDGRPRRVLEQVAARYPIVMHGVSLSVGGVDPLNRDYLQKLQELIAWVKPAWVSDHLCYTGLHGVNTHDLLPLPYTEASLAHVVGRIKQVQDVLGRPLLIENPSSYVSFTDSTMPEWEFLARMSEEADCALLLDVNNVFVSCFNHRLDTKTYLDGLPLERVVQIHLAGHRDCGTHRVDTHDAPVPDEVWALYRYVIARAGVISTMVEWDADIPPFAVVLEELNKARAFAAQPQASNDLPHFGAFAVHPQAGEHPHPQVMEALQEAIIQPEGGQTVDWVAGRADLPAEVQVGVYQDGYRFRLYDLIHDAYPVLRYYLGEARFTALVQGYIAHHVPHSPYMHPYGDGMAQWVAMREDVPAQAICVMEHALDRLFDAPETQPLAADALSEETIIGVRTASRLCHHTWRVAAYVQHVLSDTDGEPPAIEAGEEWVLVYRHGDVMRRLVVDAQEARALALLHVPRPVGDLLDALEDTVVEEQIQAWFSRWIGNGVLAIFPGSPIHEATK